MDGYGGPNEAIRFRVGVFPKSGVPMHVSMHVQAISLEGKVLIAEVP